MSQNDNIEIRAEFGPWEGDPPYAATFYEAIGRVVVLWGKFEFLLDSHLQTVINISIDKFGIDFTYKSQLAERTRLLRKIYSNVSCFSEKSASMHAFCDLVDRISEERNWLVHSTISGFSEDPPHKN